MFVRVARRSAFFSTLPYLLNLILLGGVVWAQDASTGALRGTVCWMRRERR